MSEPLLRALLDEATQQWLDNWLSVIAEHSGSITRDSIKALRTVNYMRRQGGLEPLPNSVAERWDGEFAEEIS